MTKAAYSAQRFTPTLMIQGTSSDAGKSMLVTALCRVLRRRDIAVAPFKPQNMALNSAVTADGGEIGRAQAVQALAADLDPSVHFNPVLLKPNSDTGCQVIIHGKVQSDMEAQAYHDYKPRAMQAVLQSHLHLSDQYACILVEGAGSPAEINLRDGDIANMGFAEAIDCPVILIADIDRGGVFAQLVGTLALLSPTEQARVKGFVINRFRGELSLLQSGLDWLEARTGKPVLGVLPYLMDLDLAAEDAICRTQPATSQAQLRIVIPVLPRISNHTDFDALRRHPELDVQYVPLHQSLPACDLVILPGSKHVRADLAALQAAGWGPALRRHLRYGGKLIGICGGYQMLGELIQDPLGLEGLAGTSLGLGLLPLSTELKPDKCLVERRSQLMLLGIETPVSGYEIHLGVTQVQPGQQPPMPLIRHADGGLDGAISADGQILGTYLHGLFDTPAAMKQLMQWAGADISLPTQHDIEYQQTTINRLADCIEEHLDLERILALLTPEWRTV